MVLLAKRFVLILLLIAPVRSSEEFENRTSEEPEIPDVDDPLKTCAGKDERKFYEDPFSCLIRRAEMATKQHVGILVAYGSNETLELECQVCSGERLSRFKWFKVSRSKPGKPIILVQDRLDNKHWVLDKSVLEEVVSEPVGPKKYNPCLWRKTNTLHFDDFQVPQDLGTYVCMNTRSPTHAVNNIWYHVDTILPYAKFADPVDLPAKHQMHSTVESLSQIQTLQETLDHDLAALPDFVDMYFDTLHITSRLFNDLPRSTQCGEVPVRSDRACFVRIQPEVVSQLQFADEPNKLIYNVLRHTFEFLINYQLATENNQRVIRQEAARRKAAELGFYMQINDTEIYVPCTYTLFKHLPDLDGTFNPLGKRGLYSEMVYDFACPELDPMDLINLALERDVTRMKIQILGLTDIRFMKIEKVAVEGKAFLRISCNLDPQANCSSWRSDALWKFKSAVSFHRRTMMNERIYMSENCDLVITNLERNDSGTYECFVRDPRNPAAWQRVPHIAYRVSVEKASYKWPEESDLLIGLFILITWAVCICIAWSCLMGYNYHVYTSALVIAAARQKQLKEALGEVISQDDGGMPQEEDDGFPMETWENDDLQQDMEDTAETEEEDEVVLEDFSEVEPQDDEYSEPEKTSSVEA
ncbi:hypothetical protein CRM22_009132 [Opisthorchis felineus]|uniref:Ig-like domain-containing protein n=1 Tax=Opisthorchis felineus TaxID=147828 RepID=A0A4S2L876_OPIFE|nr:hypothetical protein CRM22_009132 [Opisthorchis felineus]